MINILMVDKDDNNLVLDIHDFELNITVKQIKRALGIAASAIKAEIQKDAVNANLWDIYHAPIPMAKKISDKQKLRRESLDVIYQLLEGIHDQ